MSAYTQQAEDSYKRLRTEIDCADLGLTQPDGEPLTTVYLHPLTAGSHVTLDRALGSDVEGEFEFACFEFFLRQAQHANGRLVFDQQDREQLPYRIPKRRIAKLVEQILPAMQNDAEQYLEEAKGNLDEADLPAAAISSLKG